VGGEVTLAIWVVRVLMVCTIFTAGVFIGLAAGIGIVFAQKVNEK
jgi:uncharacterized membrane-anchored protein